MRLETGGCSSRLFWGSRKQKNHETHDSGLSLDAPSRPRKEGESRIYPSTSSCEKAHPPLPCRPQSAGHALDHPRPVNRMSIWSCASGVWIRAPFVLSSATQQLTCSKKQQQQLQVRPGPTPVHIINLNLSRPRRRGPGSTTWKHITSASLASLTRMHHHHRHRGTCPGGVGGRPRRRESGIEPAEGSSRRRSIDRELGSRLRASAKRVSECTRGHMCASAQQQGSGRPAQPKSHSSLG